MREGFRLRVGIFGGAFNPPHIGHLVCAQEARSQLRLDRFVFMPVGQAPHRTIEQDPGREVRFRLCTLVTDADDRLTASRQEIDREGPSYTVDTLQALQDSAPEDELVFVMGGDQAVHLQEWREPERVLRIARVAVVEREGFAQEQVRAALAELEGNDRVEFFSMPALDVSSTMVRERAAAGRPIRYLVTDPVAEHIMRTGLYQAEDDS